MPTTETIVPDSVRRYFQRIGSKGGQAGKGTKLRSEIATRIANERWEKIRANGGQNWRKPKGKPKKKRPQAKLPKKKKIARAPRHFSEHQPFPHNNLPPIGFK